MRIVAGRPDDTVVVDLSSGVYRAHIGVGAWHKTPCLTLALGYPPNPAAVVVNGVLTSLTSMAMVALARVPLDFATSNEDVARVAEAAVSMGSQEADVQRVKESMTLFRNLPRIRIEALDAATAEAERLVIAYWALRQWMLAPDDLFNYKVAGSVLRGTP